MRLLIVLSMLFFASVSFGQVTINVYGDGSVRRAAAPVLYEAPSPPVYAVAGGCTGRMGGSGCTGFSAGMTVYQSGGCSGGGRTAMYASGGCSGLQGGSVGFVTAPSPSYTVYATPSAPTITYAVPAQTAVYGGVPVKVSGPGMYASGQAPYGAKVGRGEWATPSGNPPPPEIFGVAGARFPLDGPVRRGIRAFWGYDPG